MVITGAAHLHPALYFKGLLSLCERRGVVIGVEDSRHEAHGDGHGWRVDTPRGSIEAATSSSPPMAIRAT